MLDVWYLFPLQAVIRQLAHAYSGVGVKEPKLDRVLGPEWRAATKRQVETWFHNRLKSEFAYASTPLPILTAHGRQDFSLFLAVANPSKAAVDLAKHFAGYVNKKYGPQRIGRLSERRKAVSPADTRVP